jgi:class 3 adenylate cyclase
MARRRFPLRWKIALFAAGLILLSVGAISLVTVYKPWREKLAAQKRVAQDLVSPLATSIVRYTAKGPVWNADAVSKLIENSSAVAPSLHLTFALLYDQGGAISPLSVANPAELERRSPQLYALYLRDKERCLTLLGAGVRGLRTLSIQVKEPDRGAPVGRLVLGYSTALIDAEARAALLSELLVLAGTLLLGGLGAILVGGRLARPLDELAAAMGKARTGDFSEELVAPAQARDEIGDLARAFNEMMQGLRERERLRGTLGRYVSGDVARRILEEQDDLSLPGELRRATVLFLDVRGFTGVSEKLAPREVVSLLNAYFSIVVEAVARSGGTVNKFIGDAALCIWGAPREAQDPELSAVRAALEIQAGAKALGELRAAQGLLTVGLGIGINTGEVLAGNLGSHERLEYTVIGDAVNTAQRLESQAKAGEVLVSEEVYKAVAARVLAEPREPVLLKGKAQPVALWSVLTLTGGARTEAA